MIADHDTTAHRYFKPSEIACVMHSLDQGLGYVLDRGHIRPWYTLTQAEQLWWVAVVEEYRRGQTPKQVYEAHSGDPWSELERDEQIRLEMGHLVVTGMSGVQR